MNMSSCTSSLTILCQSPLSTETYPHVCAPNRFASLRDSIVPDSGVSEPGRGILVYAPTLTRLEHVCQQQVRLVLCQRLPVNRYTE
jgi:hypothetical protein